MGSDTNVAATVRDRRRMISEMSPTLDSETYVYCALDPSELSLEIVGAAFAVFQEREGLSVILPLNKARAMSLPYTQPTFACITLEVYSSLEGVGLTGAVSGALAERDIPCNMVAALHHDHVFVPSDTASIAVDTLIELQHSLSAVDGQECKNDRQ